MVDASYLEQRERIWWFIRAWPNALRPHLPAPHTGKANMR